MKYLIILGLLVSSNIFAYDYAEYYNYEKEVVIIYDGDKVTEKPITLDEYIKEYL